MAYDPYINRRLDAMMKKTNMATVKLADRIEATTAAWNNPLYRDATRCLFPRVIKVINHLRQTLNTSGKEVIIFKPIRQNNNDGNWFGNLQKIFVDPRNNFIRVVTTIAHEMVHAEQYNEGRLSQMYVSSVGQTLRVWNGVAYQNAKTYQEYRNLPWEKEAFDRSVDLAVSAINATLV